MEALETVRFKNVVSPSTNLDNPHALDGDLIEEIGNACKKWGFFQVIHHGVSLDKRQKIEEKGKRNNGRDKKKKKKTDSWEREEN
ncbi:unnamed protein product [Dovyalis caffra]|uniref:Non-haem dioxygenase N-terminal domain-containing protein n=1 Tax=Dovyalis caffra TaxID=77055 RepID=A0AAV1SVH6_9ROSI|nr:unnamed protein product [Dovyalis caffra]